jgi:hypothetical protein
MAEASSQRYTPSGDQGKLDSDSLTLCCHGKKCPTITQKDGAFVLADEGQSVALSREQAALLAMWLGVKLRTPTRG